MADKIVVNAEKREGRGKNDSRRLRRDGKIPVSVYGGGGETLALIAELSQLAAVIRSGSGVNSVFTLNISGIGASEVVFHDRQIDAIKGRLMHADLRRVGAGEAAEIEAENIARAEAEAEAAAEAAADAAAEALLETADEA